MFESLTSRFSGAFSSLRSKGKISTSDIETTCLEIRQALLESDVALSVVDDFIADIRQKSLDALPTLQSGSNQANAIFEIVNASLIEILGGQARRVRFAKNPPTVIMLAGLQGAGKTTTIGKIATAQTAQGTTVLMAAGDTFRAAAAEQLQVWAERSGSAFVRGAEGGDPASVIFDGIQSAAAKGIQLVLGDTAGRLQNKSNLMEELKKVRRVADKAEGVVNEVLLVIDATTGQNGLQQAKIFTESVEVTGIVLTKLDGSAKGGVALAIEAELGIPIKWIGTGESETDFAPFNAQSYIAGLLA